jgi:hypothetical protein
VDAGVDAGAFEPVAQEELGHRRAADVGGAEEEDVDGASLGVL